MAESQPLRPDDTRPPLEKGIAEYRKWLDESLAQTRKMADEWSRAWTARMVDGA